VEVNSKYNCPVLYNTDADAWIASSDASVSFVFVCVSVSHSCRSAYLSVHAVKRKQLELTTPNLVLGIDIYEGRLASSRTGSHKIQQKIIHF